MFDYKFECYIVRGDYPYDLSQIEDLVSGTTFLLDNENFNKFLEFEDYEIHG